MFRGTGNTEPNVKHFGAGTTLSAGRDSWLIIAMDDFSINLLNLETFQLDGNRVVVEDVYFITRDEFDDCNITGNTLSDFDIDNEGMKNREYVINIIQEDS